MRYLLRFSLCFIVFVLLVQNGSTIALSAERGDPSLTATGRFVDNGDGTVTDTKRRIMWQKEDNGKEVPFEAARDYCKNLRLGGHDDWRLPYLDERDTALVVELMMPVHSRGAYARFDLYWSSDPSVLLPFNYRPAQGAGVSATYYAKKGDKAFVRAVRSM
jgi:hypothetical protein